MSERKKGIEKSSKPAFHSRVKKAAHIEKQVPPATEKREDIQLSDRRVRHYQPETVNIIKNSLKMIKPLIQGTKPELSNTHNYTSAVSAIKTALGQLADTLTEILTEDTDESSKIEHHDLLAHLFDRPGTENNGVHLVATSNIEALSNDLQLKKNSREHQWLIDNGMQELEYCILSRISEEMTVLEKETPDTLTFQHERTIELQEIAEKKYL